MCACEASEAGEASEASEASAAGLALQGLLPTSPVPIAGFFPELGGQILLQAARLCV